MNKKIKAIILILCVICCQFAGCAAAKKEDDNSLTVFNYSEYLDPEMLSKSVMADCRNQGFRALIGCVFFIKKAIIRKKHMDFGKKYI